MSDRAKLNALMTVRRHQPSRLESFVDASFAFAVTLLVISVGHVPNSVPEMLQAFRGVPAFAASFWLIARLWKAHRDWSRFYDIEDSTAIALSLVLVFITLVFVYPLRFLFSLLFAWLSQGYLADPPVDVHTIDEYRQAFEVYGVLFFAIAVVFAWLHRHALRSSDAIGLNANEREITRMNGWIWIVIGATALASAASAAVLPFDVHRGWLFAVPGCMYWGIGFGVSGVRRRYLRLLSNGETPR